MRWEEEGDDEIPTFYGYINGCVELLLDENLPKVEPKITDNITFRKSHEHHQHARFEMKWKATQSSKVDEETDNYTQQYKQAIDIANSTTIQTSYTFIYFLFYPDSHRHSRP